MFMHLQHVYPKFIFPPNWCSFALQDTTYFRLVNHYAWVGSWSHILILLCSSPFQQWPLSIQSKVDFPLWLQLWFNIWSGGRTTTYVSIPLVCSLAAIKAMIRDATFETKLHWTSNVCVWLVHETRYAKNRNTLLTIYILMHGEGGEPT